jgi:hypothetical protein
MSLYEEVGGFDRILGLCKAWHSRLQEDPLAWHPFEHGTHARPRHLTSREQRVTPSLRSRLQHFSTPPWGRFFQQPNRSFDGRRAEVHIPLRRDQVLVSGQFLDRSRWCPPH